MDHPVVQLALTKHCSGCLGTHEDSVFLNKTALRQIANIMVVTLFLNDSHLAMFIGSIYTVQNVFRSPDWMSKITVIYES